MSLQAVQLTEHWNLTLWDQISRITPDGAPRAVHKPRQKRVRLDGSARDCLVADYKAGASLGQVARKYGVDTTTATRHVTNAGVAVRPKESKIPIEDLPTIWKLRSEGHSLQSIGDRYGCTGVAIFNRLKRYEASLSGDS